MRVLITSRGKMEVFANRAPREPDMAFSKGVRLILLKRHVRAQKNKKQNSTGLTAGELDPEFKIHYI